MASDGKLNVWTIWETFEHFNDECHLKDDKKVYLISANLMLFNGFSY